MGDAHKDGHCPRETVSAPGLERAETEERLRKCCVRTVTQNISETPLRMGRGREGGIRCEKGGERGEKYVELRQVGQVQWKSLETLQFWFHWQGNNETVNKTQL